MSLEETLTFTISEEALVIRAAEGEFAAFEELINLYKQPLWKFVYRLLNNTEDANDAVQQILIQVYRSLSGLGNPASFRSWLFMIARNKCIDQLRRKSSLSFSDFGDATGMDGGDDDEGEDFSPLQYFRDPSPLPDEVIERHETQRILREAIARLPERPRQVVALRYTTDLSFAEIGEVLNMNENTAKTLFQRAKNQLRYYLKQQL